MLSVLLLARSAHAQKSEGAELADSPPRATVYAFFATWCVPCRVELPHLERLHQEYKDKGLRLVLVSEDAPSTAQSVPPFLARYNVSAEWVLDSESELLTRYNSSGSIPYTVVLDSEGGVAWAHAGYEPGDELQLESEIVKLVEQEETASPKSKLEWKLTSQTLGVWRESRFQLDDKRKRAFAERLEVAAFTPSMSASIRVDGDLVEEDTSDTKTDTDLRVERAQLKYELGAAKVTLGDDYVQFGHGMSLSLRKIDSLGLDTTLRGAGVDLSTDFLTLHAIVGVTNRQNLDTIDLQVKDEENDIIAGLETEIAVAENSTISPYVLVVDAGNAASDGSDLQW
ncbi:MAG: TlpA family protein disulfide reductase, partial [Kofleriaceae bacterium]|nr:TlpA family protein disulfide reductase [Kofleriaceae bacterium]